MNNAFDESQLTDVPTTVSETEKVEIPAFDESQLTDVPTPATTPPSTASVLPVGRERSGAQGHKWSIRMNTFAREVPDYFACVEDPEKKRKLAELVGDDEDLKCKIALISHLGNYDPELLEKVDFRDLDGYIEAAFGKGTSARSAFDGLRQLFQAELRGEVRKNGKGEYEAQAPIRFEPDPEQSKLAGAAEKFTYELYRGISGASALMWRMMADDVTLPRALDPLQDVRRFIYPESLRNIYREQARSWEAAAADFGAGSRALSLMNIAPGGEGVFQGFRNEKGELDFGRGMENLGWNLAYELPHLGIQIALTYVHPAAGAAYMGMRSAGGEYADQIDAGRDPDTAGLTAFGVGLIDAYLSYVIDTKIIRGLGEKEAKAGFRAFAWQLLKGAGKEGVEEVQEQIAGNAWRLFTGASTPLTYGEFFAALVDGVPDSFIMGALLGFPMAGVGAANDWRIAAAMDLRKRQIKDYARLTRYRDQLLAKPELTPLEMNDLRRIEALRELGDMDKVRDLLFTEALRSEALRRSGDEGKQGDPRTVDAIAADADIRRIADQRLVHDPEDSRRAVGKLGREMNIPEGKLVAYESAEELPEEVRARIEAAGNDAPFGFYDDKTDTAYINVAKTSPYLVPTIMWHEYLTHRGLRKFLGESGMNALLDDVYREYGEFIRQSGIAKRYGADLETEAGQRLAAEEFLARHAEEMSLRLTWAWDNEHTSHFRKFLSGVRKRLAPVLPRAYLAYTTDARMARMLAYALRPLEYIADDYASEGAGNGVETRFAVGGEKGAARMRDAEMRLRHLATAKKLAAEVPDTAENRRLIKLAYGWEKDVKTGQWHFELPDIKLKREIALPDGTKYERDLDDIINTTNGTLGDYCDAPELFEAYPELKNVKFRIAPIGDGGRTRGSYDPQTKTLTVDDGYLRTAQANIAELQARLKKVKESGIDSPAFKEHAQDLEARIKKLADKFFAYIDREILPHEVQHFIQRAEGFPVGGNPEQFWSLPEGLERKVMDFRKKANASEKYLRFEELNRQYEKLWKSDNDEIYAWNEKNSAEYDSLYDDPEVAALVAEKNAIAGEYGASALNVMALLDNPDDAEAWQLLRRPDGTEYDKYHNLAGEVQARNASTRSTMTEDEKRRSLLDDTADVAPEDRIYIYDALAGESDKYTAPPDDVANFKRVIENFANGTLDKRALITVTMQTPPVFFRLKLEDRGFRVFNRKITMPYSVIEKAIGLRKSTSTGEGHNLDLDTLKDLPEKIYNPIMILDSNTENSLEVYIELRDKNNKPVMVVLRVDEKVERGEKRKSEYVVNSIRSIYGKDSENTPVNRLLAGFGRYVNLQKATSWFTAFGGQFPVASKIQLASPNTIIDFSEKSSGADEDLRFALDGGFVEPKEFRGPDILNDIPEETFRIMRDLLLPAAAKNRMELFDNARGILEEKGYRLTDGQARMIASAAIEYLKERARTIRRREDNDYISRVDEYVNVLSGHFGEGFKLNFNPEFATEEKSGTWVETRKRTKEGVPADEAARVLSREWDRDVTTGELYEHFNGLTRRMILGQRSEENRAQLEAMKAAEYENDLLLWDDIRAGREKLTPQLLENHPNVARFLRKLIAKSAFMSGEELTREFYKQLNTENVPGLGDPEFVRELLTEAEGDLDALKEKLRSDKADALELQRAASDFARRHLPPEARGEFIKGVVNLLDKSTEPTPQNPQGARRRAFEDLLDRMKRRSESLRQKSLLEALEKRLSEVHSRVNQSRRVVGARDIATQELLDDIVEISRLPAAELDRRIEKARSAIEAALETGTDTSAAEAELLTLSTFGDLGSHDADSLQTALDMLNGIAKDGKIRLEREIDQRRARDREIIDWIVKRVTDGKGLKIDQEKFDANWRALEKAWGKGRDALFGLLKLEDYLYLMAANRQTGDWLESPVGKLLQKVHSSSVAKDTALRRYSEFRDKMLRDAFKVKSAEGLALKLARLRRRTDHTGIFRNSATLRNISYVELGIPEARRLVAEYDSGKAVLEEYQAEFLRDRLASLDLRMERSYKRPKEDGVTEEVLAQMDKLDQKSEYKTISYPVVEFTDGKGYEMRNLNQFEALYLHLMWQQRDVRYKMRFNGYSDETMKAVEQFLRPEVLALETPMRELLNSIGFKLDALNRLLYHAPLPMVEKYFPALYEIDKSGGGNDRLSPDDPKAGRVPTQFLPGALKARNAHVRELRIVDALQVFEGHVLQTAHYIAWAETARELRAVLLNSDVKKALGQTFGPEFVRHLKSSVTDTLNGGNLAAAEANKLIKGVNALYGNAVAMKMLFSYMSGIKQTMSAISYLNDVPLKDFLSGIRKTLAHPVETFYILNSSPYLLNRFRGGPDMWSARLLDRSGRRLLSGGGKLTAAANIAKVEAEWLIDLGGWFTRFGDMVPVILAGASVYHYHYNKMIAEGFSPAEAKRHALLRWEMSTESLQQSRAVHNQNAIQRGNAKFLTAFKSAQILNAQRPLREAIALRFFGEQHRGLKRDVAAYREHLKNSEATKSLRLTPAEQKRLEKFYKDFPLGKTITNRWGEALTFAPLDEFNVERYIHHFAVKRGKDANGMNWENFSAEYLSLFENLRETLKNPDERILTVTDTGDPRINYLKRITTRNGNHYVIAAVAQDGRIVPWTHMDSKDKYIEKQRAAEKLAVEKYGLMDGDGNRVYMTYDEYLKKKADIPLYLATAEPNQSMAPQTAISDRGPNIARPGELSRPYSGVPAPRSHKTAFAATLVTMVAVAALIKAVEQSGRLSRGKDQDKDPDEMLFDILVNAAADPFAIFPTLGTVPPALISLVAGRPMLSGRDPLFFTDDVIKALRGSGELLEDLEEGDFDEETFDAAVKIAQGIGLISPGIGAGGSFLYRAKQLYEIFDHD